MNRFVRDPRGVPDDLPRLSVRILAVVARGGVVRLPQRRAWTIWIVREGRPRVTSPNWKPFLAKSGFLFLGQREQPLRLDHPPGAEGLGVVFDVIERSLRPAPAGGWRPDLGSEPQPGPSELWNLSLPVVLHGRWAATGGRLVVAAVEAWPQGGEGALLAETRLAAWFAELLAAALRRRLVATAADDPGAPGWLQAAEQHGRETFASGCTVADLATVAGLSRSRFCARFVAERGRSPGAWLRRLRLEEACRLLLAGDAPIAEIARRSGYRSPSTFARAFRAAEGLEPALWRRQRRGELVEPVDGHTVGG